jgi:opacity protein-like surface antigen/outer membrane protease
MSSTLRNASPEAPFFREHISTDSFMKKLIGTARRSLVLTSERAFAACVRSQGFVDRSAPNATSAGRSCAHANRLRILAALSVASSGGAALAADVDVLAPVPMQQAAPQGPRWNGFSVGINGGGLWAPGQSEKQFWFPASLPTAGLPSAFSFSPRGLMAGAQVGFNKQWGDFVVGGVADFDIVGGAKSSVSSSGVYTGAPPPVPFTTAQSQQLQNLGTIRARVGYTPFDDLLVYATGGLAFGQADTSTSLTFTGGGTFSGARTDTAVGWAAGAGAEYALDSNWSVGVDLLYYNLGDIHNVGAADFVFIGGPGTPKSNSTFEFSGYTLRLGLDYSFDGSNDSPAAKFSRDPVADFVGTFGVRAGLSTSSAQLKLYDFGGATKLSQLTYHNVDSGVAEIYGRLDEPGSGLFTKGYAAFGKQTNGNLQDEDFPPGTSPYSSTNSTQSGGHLSYASMDVGYYAMQGGWYKIGGFAGYHFLSQSFNAFGCTQTATNPSVCAAGDVASADLTISDSSMWRSVRVGLAGEMSLPAGFSVRAEAAWLPYIIFTGDNNHWLRTPEDFSGALPEQGDGSNGYQLEAEVNYSLSRNFDIGVGGRYWAMNAKGHVLFQDAASTGGPQVATFHTDLAQVFLQSAYHF